MPPVRASGTPLKTMTAYLNVLLDRGEMIMSLKTPEILSTPVRSDTEFDALIDKPPAERVRLLMVYVGSNIEHTNDRANEPNINGSFGTAAVPTSTDIRSDRRFSCQTL
jgi:hypothetical protein